MEFITYAAYKRNYDPKGTGDKKWPSVLLYKMQTEHCQNDLMCSDLLPAQCGNATAVSQDSSPQTLQLLVIMSWLGPVSVKRQHFPQMASASLGRRKLFFKILLSLSKKVSKERKISAMVKKCPNAFCYSRSSSFEFQFGHYLFPQCIFISYQCCVRQWC